VLTALRILHVLLHVRQQRPSPFRYRFPNAAAGPRPPEAPFPQDLPPPPRRQSVLPHRSRPPSTRPGSHPPAAAQALSPTNKDTINLRKYASFDKHHQAAPLMLNSTSQSLVQPPGTPVSVSLLHVANCCWAVGYARIGFTPFAQGLPEYAHNWRDAGQR
jgi:hypothetical protein